jgi:hypothetical protein
MGASNGQGTGILRLPTTYGKGNTNSIASCVGCMQNEYMHTPRDRAHLLVGVRRPAWQQRRPPRQCCILVIVRGERLRTRYGMRDEY